MVFFFWWYTDVSEFSFKFDVFSKDVRQLCWCSRPCQESLQRESCDRVLCAFRGQALASFLRPKKKLSVAIRFHGSIVDMNMSVSVWWYHWRAFFGYVITSLQVTSPSLFVSVDMATVQRSKLSPKVQWILLTERPVVGQVTLRGCHWSDASHGKKWKLPLRTAHDELPMHVTSCDGIDRIKISTFWERKATDMISWCLMPPDVCCNMRLKLIPGPIGFRALQLFEDRSVRWLFYSFDSFLVVFQKDLTWSDPPDIDTGMT